MVAIRDAQRRDAIAAAVCEMYTAVARTPDAGFHFPTGRAAAELAGYDDAWLDALPPDVIVAFAGVGCPFDARVVRPGDTVLDVGSGAGTDALIASLQVGASGCVIALDRTPAMLERLARSARAAGFRNIETVHADAESMPLAAASVDVVTSNGALNLVPDKPRALAEIARVLRPGGWLQLSDVVLGAPVSAACRADPRLWVECVVGATLEPALLGMLDAADLGAVQVLDRLDYFAASPSADTREIAAALHAQAITLRARR